MSSRSQELLENHALHTNSRQAAHSISKAMEKVKSGDTHTYVLDRIYQDHGRHTSNAIESSMHLSHQTLRDHYHHDAGAKNVVDNHKKIVKTIHDAVQEHDG